MYEDKYVNVSDMVTALGMCREKVLRLCQERPCGFPAIKVGNRYRADRDLLEAWRTKFYSGSFDLKV